MLCHANQGSCQWNVTRSGLVEHILGVALQPIGHVQNSNHCKLTPERADLLVRGYHNLSLLRKYRASAALPRDTNILRCWYPSEDEEEPDSVKVNVVNAQPRMDRMDIEID
jgi:hypothetical protein